MAMIPCPNGGKCGSRNHRVGSAAYDRCVQDSTGDAYKSPFVRLTNTPRTASNDSDIELGSLTRTFKRSGAYVQADSPVFSEVSLNSRQVQDYIDNPQSVSFNDKQESLINEGIQHYIGDILDDAGIDIDELSPEEVDIASQAARKAMDRKDALDCVAERWGLARSLVTVPAILHVQRKFLTGGTPPIMMDLRNGTQPWLRHISMTSSKRVGTTTGVMGRLWRLTVKPLPLR